jgi:hypothetical protein
MRFWPGKEVTNMNAAVTIEDFNALLKSKQSDSSLLEVLRQLTALRSPEDVRALATEPEVAWLTWSSPPSG